ncbi:MAG: hypothetical protein KGN76_10890 [Acidobacteriota bacterium]|nr:hypothetical protein [Acidobacteriota bacterium]
MRQPLLHRMTVRWALVPPLVALALVVTRLAWPVLQATPFVPLWAVVLWAASDHRRGPAQLAILLGMAGSWAYLPGQATLVHVAGFGVLGLGASELVTGRMRARRELARNESKFRAFFEADLVANFIADPDGRLAAWNTRFDVLVGPAAQPRSLVDLLGADAFRAMRDRVAHGGLAWYPALAVQGPARQVHAEARFMGIHDADNQLLQIAGCLVDVGLGTPLQNQQKLDALERLVVGLVHRFKNQLAIIVGRSELLASRLEPVAAVRTDLHELQYAAARANELTTGLVAFSRQHPISPVEVVVDELLRGLPLPPAAGIEVVYGLAAAGGRVAIDLEQMTRVLESLVANAVEAMPEGGTLTLETAFVEVAPPLLQQPDVAPGRYVQIAISDTGAGMAADVRERLFEPFFTTKGTTERAGLSLAIAHGLVRQGGGFVDVQSQPGAGTTLEIYLPAVASDDDGPVDVVSALGFDFGTVLAVSGDDARRAALVQAVTRYGYTGLEAATAEAASACIRETPALRAVLLDAPRVKAHEPLSGSLDGVTVVTVPAGPLHPVSVIRRIRAH